MDSNYEVFNEANPIPTSRDYAHLKELLDANVEVLVMVQILPNGYKKDRYVAKSGNDGEKYYDIGHGLIYTDDAFFDQCKGLDLEYIEPNLNQSDQDDDVDSTKRYYRDPYKPNIRVVSPTIGKKNGHICVVVHNLTYQQANVIRKMVHSWD